MNVMFDVGVLGAGVLDSTARTGVHRVARYLTRMLAETDDVTLRFCAPESADICQAAYAVTRTDPLLRRIPFKRPRRLAFSRQLRRVEQVFIRAGWTRGGEGRQRSALGRAVRALEPERCPPGPSALAWADLYHSPFFPFPDALSSAGRAGPVRVMTIHDLIHVRHPEVSMTANAHWTECVLRQLRATDWACCDSRHTRAELLSYRPDLDPARVRVVYNTVDSVFRPMRCADVRKRVCERYGLGDDPFVLSVATLEPRKNLHTLLEAFFRLLREREVRDLNLVLVGPRGWLSGNVLDGFAVYRDLWDRVRMTGYVEDSDLPAVYSAARMFVYLSLYEGFGLPPLEAMACGTPVIASNATSLPEVVGDGGMQLDPHDVDGVAAELWNLYGSDEACSEWSRRGLEQATRFSWEKFRGDILALYRDALAERAGSGV